LIDFRVRAGAAEMHNVAALQGGIISQEIIKIITHQYIPMNNTCILNTLKASSTCYEL